MKNWFDKNKVFFLGLLSAVAVAITPFVQTADATEIIKWSTIGFAVMIGTLSYFANAWRGQGLTIFGIIGNISGVITSLLVQGSAIKPDQFIIQLILQTILAVSMAAGADPKSRGYEKTQVIQDAKKEGEAIQPATMTEKPK